MEKFPGYSGINSAISDLTAVISNKLAKADSQISELGVSCRPKADSNHLFEIINLISFYTTLGAISFNI
jgi:hypothetical protein